MSRRLMGVETEYAFSGLGPDGEVLGAGPLLEGPLLDLARQRLPTLRDAHHRGVFFGNGSCLYVDQGNHPEFCTPECTDPWEVVRYVQAGDRMLRALCEAMVGTVPALEEVFLARTNVCYTGAGATWGTHESHMHRMDSRELARQILPHLVSRIVYSGDGGFDPFSPGIEFRLSPRTAFLVRVRSEHSTSQRGIFHTKNEPLCRGGFRRLHLICGNSLHSQTALWLTMAATALVVRLAEAGKAPGAAVAMRAPLKAMRAFAADASCSRRVRLASGRRATAVDVQRHYLSLAEGHLGEAFLPAWAEEACRRWRAALDGLESGAGGAGRSLDWAIKHAVFSRHVERRGTDWRRVRRWTRVLKPLHAVLVAARPATRGLSVERVLGPGSLVRGQAEAMAPRLAEEGLRWDDLGEFLQLREELLALDTRFAEVSDRGIFRGLDAAGVLDHEVVEPGDIDRAVDEPPAEGRARLRGRLIQRFRGDRRRADCGWEGVWDHDRRRFLDLADPFETVERWKAYEGPPRPGSRLSAVLRGHRLRLDRELLEREAPAPRPVRVEAPVRLTAPEQVDLFNED